MSESRANNQDFSRPGAIDLSRLAAQAGNPDTADNAAGGSYTVALDEQNLEQILQSSMQYPVIVSFHSDRDPAGAKVDQTLQSLAGAAGGRWLLARVDVDAQPRVAQAFGVQAVPTVFALLSGQPAPLFQGTADPEQIKQVLDQVMQIAMQNGLTGRAAPVSNANPETGESDPRFAAADEALAREDYDAAIVEFDKLLAANPRDVEAKVGRSTTALLSRTKTMDPDAVAKADASPKDPELARQAADVELLMGQPDRAFGRLIAAIRVNFGDEREGLRTRLLELFETVDPKDPSVQKARRDLALALF